MSGISHSTAASASPTSEGKQGTTTFVQPGNLPKASPVAIEFLEFLDECDFKYILFEDKLVTISEYGKELGEFNVSVTKTKLRGEECYLVHANSHGSLDGVPCGTSITAHISKNLETLEQHHNEYVKLDNHPLDRKTIIFKEFDSYSINRISTQGKDVQRTHQNFTFEEMKGFISEGSNLLLERLLAKRGQIEDDFSLISFDSDARICPVSYKNLAPRTQIVCETELDVRGIERTISSSTNLPTTWQAYYTKDGHLTSRVQVGSPVTMRLAFVPTPIEEDTEIEKPTFEKKDLVWEEDMEMYSKFMDKKDEYKNEHNCYLRHHPELNALLADFLQFLLLRKPDDVVSFAAEFFGSFSINMPVNTPYLHSTEPTPFPASRTNSKIEFLARPKDQA